MQFIAGALNKKHLLSLLESYTPVCTRVRAAVAYASKDNMRLFEKCQQLQKPLDFFGRYDETVPVSPEILKWFLQPENINYQCRFVPDLLHSKVIWWEGAGAYIGSANLTDNGWFRNIEAGIALSHADLVSNGVEKELRDFFDNVYKNSEPLSDEIYKEQLALSKKQSLGIPPSARVLSRKQSLLKIDPVSAGDKDREKFQKEWRETLQMARDISYLCSSEQWRPTWVGNEISSGVLGDRFLHIYYQNIVKEGTYHPIEKYHQKNRNNTAHAVEEALRFWKEGNYKQEFDYKVMSQWAPRLQVLLAQNQLLELTKEEFIEMVSYVHAMRDHARKFPKELLGLSNAQQTEDTMAEKFGEWLWNNHVHQEKCLLKTLYYVIWGSGNIEERIWDAVHTDKWEIPRVGISALGEIVGWARPDEYPPRNQRTSKALRALGYNVREYNS